MALPEEDETSPLCSIKLSDIGKRLNQLNGCIAQHAPQACQILRIEECGVSCDSKLHDATGPTVAGEMQLA